MKLNIINALLADLSECDSGVCGGDLFAVDDLCLLEPLVRLTQLDGLAIRGLVSELGKGRELLFKGLRVPAAPTAAAARSARRGRTRVAAVVVSHLLLL